MVDLHSSPEELQRFAAGQLDEASHYRLEQHLGTCLQCWELIEKTQNNLPLVRFLRHVYQGHLDQKNHSGREPAPIPPACLLNHSRYQFIEFIGQGGMGQVWKARHELMNRLVAVKVINPAFLTSARAIERFRREIQTAAQLSHPNIVNAYDAEQIENIHLLVMEYIEGVSLANLIAQQSPLPVALACEYARQTANGLQEAHERGMVHRDIKPQNLLLTPQGVVKILDFGLAAFLSEPDDKELPWAAASTAIHGSLTRVSEGCGTPDYISPEQVRNARNVDIRADIYSLGCTLYHLLAGKPPFAGGTGYSKVAGHLERTPVPLSTMRDDLPTALLEVVERMLAKDPKQRCQTPAEVALALASFAKGETGSSSRSPVSRRRWIVSSAATSLSLLGGWFLWKSSRIPLAKESIRFEGHTSAIQNVALSSDEKTALSGSEDRTMRLWSLETGKELQRFDGHSQLVSRVRFLPGDQQALSSSFDRTLRLWNLQTGREVRRFVGFHSPIHNVAVSPEGSRFLSAGGLVVNVCDVASGQIERQLGNEGRGAVHLQFFADGRRAITGGSDRLVHFWKLETGEELAVLGEHSHSVETGGLSSDERLLLVGCHDKTAWLWDLNTRQLLQKQAYPHKVYRVVPTLEGFWVACNDDQGEISVWDFATRRELFRLQGHQAVVWGLEFSADRRRALTGSKDGTVRVWDIG